MTVLKDRGGHLLASGSATASGAAAANTLDLRTTKGAYLWYVTPANSAVITVDVSHDATAWLVYATYTATTTTGTAQYSEYLPYVRAHIQNRYGAATGFVHISPLVVS